MSLSRFFVARPVFAWVLAVVIMLAGGIDLSVSSIFALAAFAAVSVLFIFDLPVWLALFVPEDFRVFLLLRLLRFFKLARYSPGMRSLVAALEAPGHPALGRDAGRLFNFITGYAKPDEADSAGLAKRRAQMVVGLLVNKYQIEAKKMFLLYS